MFSSCALDSLVAILGKLDILTLVVKDGMVVLALEVVGLVVEVGLDEPCPGCVSLLIHVEGLQMALALAEVCSTDIALGTGLVDVETVDIPAEFVGLYVEDRLDDAGIDTPVSLGLVYALVAIADVVADAIELDSRDEDQTRSELVLPRLPLEDTEAGDTLERGPLNIDRELGKCSVVVFVALLVSEVDALRDPIEATGITVTVCSTTTVESSLEAVLGRGNVVVKITVLVEVVCVVMSLDREVGRFTEAREISRITLVAFGHNIFCSFVYGTVVPYDGRRIRVAQ